MDGLPDFDAGVVGKRNAPTAAGEHEEASATPRRRFRRSFQRGSRMIEQKSALRHVESFRFANLDFAPDPEGTKVLAKMLAKHALSDEHAGAVVASWIAHWPKWPRPSDIKQACESTAD